MAFTDLAGVRSGFDCAGSSSPALIFVHGGFCNRSDWAAQVATLAGQFRVVTMDMPGHGESALPAEPSVEALAKSVVAINALHGAGRALLVGHSLGVDVILEAYRQSSSGVAGLILIEGGLVADGEPDRAVANFKQGVKAMGFQAFIEAAFNEMFTPASDPQLRQRVLARLKAIDPEFAQEVILSKIRWDAAHAARTLAQVNVPVLLIQSTYFDETFKRRSLEPGMTTPWTELVTRKLPGTEVALVPDVGHFPQIEAPEAVNDHIGRFAGRLRASGA